MKTVVVRGDAHYADEVRGNGYAYVEVPEEWIGAQVVAALEAQFQLWEPLQTAPRDGTRVLVYCAVGAKQHVAFWKDGLWLIVEGFGAAYCTPTHWMPLPKPPGQHGDE